MSSITNQIINSYFNDIIEDLNSLSIKDELYVNHRLINRNKDLYIIFKFNKKTSLNPYKNSDIYFSLLLFDSDEIPELKCMTDFCFPSLNDNRNFYPYIMNLNNDSKTNKEENIIENNIENYYTYDNKISSIGLLNGIDINTLKKIINKISEFIKNMLYLEENKLILNNIKELGYEIDRIYDINEFFGCSCIKFYRANLMTKLHKETKETQKYIILTDIFFLIFDPVPNKKNMAKLIFEGNIKYLMNIEINENDYIIRIKWIYNDNKKEEIIKSTIDIHENELENENESNNVNNSSQSQKEEFIFLFQFEENDFQDFRKTRKFKLKKLVKSYKISLPKTEKDMVNNNNENDDDKINDIFKISKCFAENMKSKK